MEKFKIKAGPGGYFYVYWRDVLVTSGRPWITSDGPGYSELLLKIYEDKDSFDFVEHQSEEIDG